MHRLQESGYVAYVVGGSVRDFLLGVPSKDHDIATDALPDALETLFPNSILVGKQFGVIKIPVQSEPETDSDLKPAIGPRLLEIATFRSDGGYSDYRHPMKVRFSGIEEDAKRRDYSVNALFYDPKTQRIFDPVGGMEDLKARVLRAIGEPARRFQEDALRLLRGIRIAASHGFKIEDTTWVAIQKNVRLITKISAERVRDEITGILIGAQPGAGCRLLAESGLLRELLPELEKTRGLEVSPDSPREKDVWSHTLKILDNLAKKRPRRGVPLCWAALLHDVGKPVAAVRNERKNFNGHEIDGVRIAESVCRRLRLSGDEISTVVALINDHLKFRDVFNMREATLQRWLREPYFEELLSLHHADAIATDGNLAYYEFCAKRHEEMRQSPAPVQLIDGQDLIQLGLLPGPKFAQILATVEDLALERKLTTKEQALEFVLKHFID